LSVNSREIDILKTYPENIDWNILSGNENAFELLKQYPHKINWCILSNNKNEKVIELLKENREKINWNMLSMNPNAIDILKQNVDRINWNLLSSNSSIFTYDYEKMRNSNQNLKEEIIAAALNPKRIFRLIAEYGEDIIYDIYLDD
jgi:predicted HAD superfamily phosphohydrolase